METEKLFYYTDFNTFKLILQNGTLRFKESTASNDKLDTVQLYTHLLEMAERKYAEAGIQTEQKFYFDMLRYNGAPNHRFALVACFTSKADSRLLWDAYTMHRKDRSAERYNGVCIEFDRNKLSAAMENESDIFDIRRCQRIIYGFNTINQHLEAIMEAFSKEVEFLSKYPNQEQNIVPPIPIPMTRIEMHFKKCLVYPMLHLNNSFDAIAPFFKHSFWREECETRALLSIKQKSKMIDKLGEYSDGSKYYDLNISAECINKVILGPEFSSQDIEIVNSLPGKIAFCNLISECSEGTNVITNR